MLNSKRILELLAEIQHRLNEITSEVERFQQGVSGGTISTLDTEGTPSARLTDLANIVWPTVDDPSLRMDGGQETQEFPDCCAIGNDKHFYGTGILITPTLVITAGHHLTATRVFLKGSNVAKLVDGETIRVVSTFLHPRFDHQFGPGSVDLLILILEHPASVRPRHIAHGLEIQQSYQAQAGLVRLVGFGSVKPGATDTMHYDKKRMLDVRIESLDCSTVMESASLGCLPQTELVAGHRGLLRDACKGDSGAPLYIMSPSGEYYLLGVMSRATNYGTHICGRGAIYTRVDQFIDWIQEQIG